MEKFDDFRQGWWNCFLTFADINQFYADANDIPCLEVLEGAGVSVEEIDAVLNDDRFGLPGYIVRYLNFYKDKKLNHK